MLNNLKKWWKTPITWGAYMKLAGICSVISAAMIGVAVLNAYKETKEFEASVKRTRDELDELLKEE